MRSASSDRKQKRDFVSMAPVGCISILDVTCNSKRHRPARVEPSSLRRSKVKTLSWSRSNPDASIGLLVCTTGSPDACRVLH